MKIYRIQGDHKYQALTFGYSADPALAPKTYSPAYEDTRALLPIEFTRLVPWRREGDFRWLGPSFTCSDPTLQKVGDLLERDGQVLEITVDDDGDRRNYLFHPTNQLQAVDMSVVQPLMDAQGAKWIRHYAFKRELFVRPQLFADRYFMGEIFCATEVGELDRDFYVRCAQLRLTGIRFEQVWQG